MSRQDTRKGIYNASFYLGEGDEILRSPTIVAPHVYSLLKPRRVVDVGCGRGAWLAVFRELGAQTILGLEGKHVDPSCLLVPPDCLRNVDLTKPFVLDQEFDLAICLEVAEHIPDKSAADLVASLVRLAPCVLFSAAVPYQGGCRHVNEQWPDYWEQLFARQQFRCLDLFRKHIWKNPGVKYWYRQNLFLYVREELIAQRPEFLEASQEANDLMLVHADILRAQLGLRSLLANLPRALFETAARKLRRFLPQAGRS